MPWWAKDFSWVLLTRVLNWNCSYFGHEKQWNLCWTQNNQYKEKSEEESVGKKQAFWFLFACRLISADQSCVCVWCKKNCSCWNIISKLLSITWPQFCFLKAKFYLFKMVRARSRKIWLTDYIGSAHKLAVVPGVIWPASMLTVYSICHLCEFTPSHSLIPLCYICIFSTHLRSILQTTCASSQIKSLAAERRREVSEISMFGCVPSSAW